MLLFYAILMLSVQVSIEADCRSVIFENDLGESNLWKPLKVQVRFLVPLSDLKTFGDGYIHVLMIATLEENIYSSMSLKILDQLSKLFKSIIQNSLGSSLHLIIVSDENSKNLIRYELFENHNIAFIT